MIQNLSKAPEDVQLLAKEWPLCYSFELEYGDKFIVAGAYKGKVMELLARLYNAIPLGFEPQGWAYEKALERMRTFPNSFGCWNFAIGATDGEFKMGEWFTDACSFVNVNSRETGVGRMREFGSVMEELELGRIKLAIFNMEGYEYILVPHLIKTGWIERIDKLAIQWHVNFAGGYHHYQMNDLINKIEDSGFELVTDDRPSWVYFRR